MNGLHIIAEFHDCRCDQALLRELAPLRKICLDACNDAGLTVVAEVFHAFGSPDAPAGATGALVLAESHLAIHTWPEINSVTIDIYVCNFSQDNRSAAEYAFTQIEEHFHAARCIRRNVERGTDQAIR